MSTQKVDSSESLSIMPGSIYSLKNRIIHSNLVTEELFDKYLDDNSSSEKKSLISELVNLPDEFNKNRFIHDLLLLDFINYLLRTGVIQEGDQLVGKLADLMIMDKRLLKEHVESILKEGASKSSESLGIVLLVALVCLSIVGMGVVEGIKKGSFQQVLEIAPYLGLAGLGISSVAVLLSAVNIKKYPQLAQIFHKYLGDLSEG